MNVWGIADLHLSHAKIDPRERYGARWKDHAEKIAANWRAVVAKDDLVLIPGDISMALNHRQVQPDLAWLHQLPGTKVLSPGNHDRWWNGAEKVRKLLRPSLLAVDGDGDVIEAGEILICGSLGSPPVEGGPDAVVERLRSCLSVAVGQRRPGQPLVVLWHYSPFATGKQAGSVVGVLEDHGVTACVYGHLHQMAQWSAAVQGLHQGVRYYCVAADAVGFRPLRILLP